MKKFFAVCLLVLSGCAGHKECSTCTRKVSYQETVPQELSPEDRKIVEGAAKSAAEMFNILNLKD